MSPNRTSASPAPSEGSLPDAIRRDHNRRVGRELRDQQKGGKPERRLLDALHRPGTVFLDTSEVPVRHGGWSRGEPAPNERSGVVPPSMLFHTPVDVIRADTGDQVSHALEQADQALNRGYFVAGALTYEAGLALAGLPCHSETGSLLWFGVYEKPHQVSSSTAKTAFSAFPDSPDFRNARFDVSREEYLASIQRIKTLIREGDVYQINYTGPLRFDLDLTVADADALYARMRRRQPVPYGAYLHLGDARLLCASPELFIRREGRRLVTRPMKGTIRRGQTPDEDRELQRQLASDAKSQAENLMIVDLLRNDLSVCCRPGSVHVPELYTTETYDTITQMTSTVTGELDSDTSFSRIMKSLFPCGSITGAPKRRAMQRIHELESGPRGFYCGAIGYASPHDRMCFNVSIRTVTLRGGTGVMGTGSGIVWDSDPEAEYKECLLKTQFLASGLPSPRTSPKASADPESPLSSTAEPPSTRDSPAVLREKMGGPFRLIETMRRVGGEIPLWRHHAARLRRSAEAFGIPVDLAAIWAAIEDATGAATGDPMERVVEQEESVEDGQTHVVRLTVGWEGDARVQIKPMPDPVEMWRLAVVREVADARHPAFRHKTTRRDAYTRAWQQAREACCDEGILLNARGEVTEGSRSNVFAQFGSRWVTPPAGNGGLEGVYRAHILETVEHAAVETLTIDDLRAADGLFCCNAVRGRIPATISADLRADA